MATKLRERALCQRIRLVAKLRGVLRNNCFVWRSFNGFRLVQTSFVLFSWTTFLIFLFIGRGDVQDNRARMSTKSLSVVVRM